jgi:cytochrome b6-f complex iron-sulfur subunit
MTTTPAPSSKPSAFVPRRQFIQIGLLAMGAAWLGTWLQTRLFPSTSTTGETTPVSFPLSDLPVGGTKAITYGGVSVLVVRTPESLRAFSLVCTHLGCLVQWQTDKNEFYCPCHDGRFDEFGDVLAGPPPIPLEQFPVNVDQDMVTIGEI